MAHTQPVPVILCVDAGFLDLALTPAIYAHFGITRETSLEVWTDWKCGWRTVPPSRDIYVPAHHYSVFARVLGSRCVGQFVKELRLVHEGTPEVVMDPTAISMWPVHPEAQHHENESHSQ